MLGARASFTTSATSARIRSVTSSRAFASPSRALLAMGRSKKERGKQRVATKSATQASANPHDYDAPELPDYDIVTMGPLDVSAVALSVKGWTGGSDDANAYVAAIDRGYLLIGAASPEELRLAKEYEGYWSVSEAAELPGVRAPMTYAIVDVDDASGGGGTVKDILQAHTIAAGGCEPDVFCLRADPWEDGENVARLAEGIVAAWELGACGNVIAVDGFNGDAVGKLVDALKDTPEIKVAFNRVAFSLADRSALENGDVDACKSRGVGVLAVDPLGEGSRVTNVTHAECDQAQCRLLAFLGSMVGGGVQKSPTQVGVNYVVSKGIVPEIETRYGSVAWECGGAMLWRLDENALGILDERADAVAAGESGVDAETAEAAEELRGEVEGGKP